MYSANPTLFGLYFSQIKSNEVDAGAQEVPSPYDSFLFPFILTRFEHLLDMCIEPVNV